MDIEKLANLEAKGTSAPWILDIGKFHCSIKIGSEYISAPYQQPYGRGDCEQQHIDGELIAASRNSLGPLIQIARAAKDALVQFEYILNYAKENKIDEVLYSNLLSECDSRANELRTALGELKDV